jgi:ABC-type transport system involved in multi-copper enzyme maturation permease subunit
MRTLFLRELHQGRALLAFSALLGVLVPLGHLALAHTATYRFYAPAEQHDLAGIFGRLMLLLPLVVAIFAGAGLFAAEADRGTLPALFALPFSRRRIWAAKALGGLAVTILGAAIIVGLGALLLPRAARAVSIPAYLPDVGMGLAFVFAVALFASSLTSTALAAVVFAVLLGGLLAMGVGLVWAGLGGVLLGYHPLLDLALWGLAAAPALCLASAVVVGRCELLQSRRKYLLAFAALVAGLLVTLLVVCGLARWVTRYDRDRVESIWVGQWSIGSPVVALSTSADPVPLERGQDGGGWRHRLTSQQSNEVGTSRHGPLYRSSHYVFLDLRSGRELLAVRGPSYGFGACSPDGRFAASIGAPRSITWGRPDDEQQLRTTLRVYDLGRGRRVFAGAPRAEGVSLEDNLGTLAWSPSGKWLAISATNRSAHGKPVGKLYAIRPDGSGLRDLHAEAQWYLSSWAWSPVEEALYACDGAGRVSRVSVEGGRPAVIWSPAEASERPPYALGLQPSPDGKWVVLALSRETGPEEEPTRITDVYAIPTGGGPARTVLTLTPPIERRSRFSHARLAWAADSTALFLLTTIPEGPSRLLRWRPGEEAAAQLGPPLPHGALLAVAPGSSRALVYPWRQDEAAFLVDADGNRQAVLSAGFARTHEFAGFDDRGRVITKSWREGRPAVEVTDLRSGKREHVYP